MTLRSRCKPPTMNFSEDVKYYLKILYYEYFPQHHAKKNEESGEAQRERYALMRSRCSEVPHKMSFREDVAARYSRKIVYFSAVLAPTHTRVSRQKKNETFSLLSSLSHLFELLLLRSCFPSRLLPRGVRVGGCVFLFVRRSVCATPKAKGTTTTRQKGKRVQDVEDQDDNKRWATRFRAR